MAIETSWETEGDSLVVVLRGTMTFHDYGASDALLETLSQRIGAKSGITSLVFDLAGVDMIDSHWLGMFVRALKRAQESNLTVVLRRAQPAVHRLLDLVQFGRVFDIRN